MKKLRTIDLYLIPLLFVGIVTVILRSVALLTSFNTITMHFDDKIAITISAVMVLLAIIGFATYLFLGEKERELIARTDNARNYIPAGIVSIALLFMGARNFGMAFEIRYTGIISTLSFICGVLSFLSAASFFLSVFIEKNEHLYKAAFSLSIVFFLALYSVILFYNREIHPTNSPNKIVDQLAYVSAALFFLYDSRIYLSRAKWRGYVTFGLIATMLCAYSAIPSLIVYAFNGYLVSDSLIESLLTLAVTILIASKVVQIRSLTPADECDAAKSISALAMLRKEEMEEARKLSHVQDNIIKEETDDTEDTANYTFDLPEADTIPAIDDAEDDNTEKNQ